MSDRSPNTVEELFNRAASLPPEKHADFLDLHCRDELVRREVEALLKYDRLETGGTRDRLEINEPAPTKDLKQAAKRAGKRQLGSSSGLSDSIEHGQFLPGHVLADRYRIVGLLGKGGMGEVYRADDLELGQSVALKFLPRRLADDPQALERFRGEVRLARQVSHPNVSRVYDIGLADDLWFLSMEYVDGEDLAHLLPRIGRFSHERATELARQLCLGLHAAHEKGVLHRDLKPANVMIDGRGKLLITDFGLAAVASEVRDEDIRSGTPAYMSPEQLAGREVTERSDIYSLGIILHEIYTGKPAWQANTMAELYAQRKSSPTPTPSSHVDDLDPMVDRIISRCLDPAPEKRPPSAIAVLAALPGGDPLQAALAAGETPSPEMVAASGHEGGLSISLGGALLAAFCLFIAAVPMILDYRGYYDWGELREYEPAVLKKTAVELIRSIGGGEQSTASARGFELSKRREFEFWYRQTSQSLEPNLPDLYESTISWQVTPTNPSPTIPGMVTVWLNSSGRLLKLLRVPGPDFEPSSQESTDWRRFFEQLGLDEADYVEIEAAELARQFRPPFSVDEVTVWKNEDTDRDNARLVLATRGRQLVYFAREDFEANRGDPSDNSRFGKSGFWYMTVTFALFLAWRNLKRGNADIRGATRLAVYFLVVDLLLWLCVIDNCGGLYSLCTFGINVLMRSLSVALRIWLYYVGFEPYVRRFWPQSLIAWSRLLSGDLTNRLVGREILIGCVAGGFLAVLFATFNSETPVGIQPSAIEDESAALAMVFQSNRTALGLMLMFVMVLTAFTLILKRTWIVVAAWLLVASFFLANLGDFWSVLSLLAAAIDLFLVIRVGFLAAVAGRFTLHLLTTVPTTCQLGDWYAMSGLMAMSAALILAVYGYYICAIPGSRLADSASR